MLRPFKTTPQNLKTKHLDQSDLEEVLNEAPTSKKNALPAKLGLNKPKAKSNTSEKQQLFVK